jgi:cell division septum initiation protein DivIVA
VNPATSFKRSLRGYDPAQVHDHLEELSVKLEDLKKENAALRRENAEAGQNRRSSGIMESRLSGMLAKMEATSAALIEQNRTNAAVIAAQTEHERMVLRKNARDEAALIIRDAERRAQSLIDDAHKSRIAVLEEIALLRARRATLIARIKAVLVSQLEFLRSLEKDGAAPAEDAVPIPPRMSANEGLGADELASILASLDASLKTENE